MLFNSNLDNFVRNEIRKLLFSPSNWCRYNITTLVQSCKISTRFCGNHFSIKTTKCIGWVNKVHKISNGFPKILATKLTTSVCMSTAMQIVNQKHFQIGYSAQPNYFWTSKTFSNWKEVERDQWLLQSENISESFYQNFPPLIIMRAIIFSILSTKRFLAELMCLRSSIRKIARVIKSRYFHRFVISYLMVSFPIFLSFCINLAIMVALLIY